MVCQSNNLFFFREIEVLLQSKDVTGQWKRARDVVFSIIPINQQ